MEAKASLTSITSQSEMLRLYLESSFGIAMEGPMPIMRGATPATVTPTNLATMGWPSSMARERFMRRTAAAERRVLVWERGYGRNREEVGYVGMWDLPPSVT